MIGESRGAITETCRIWMSQVTVRIWRVLIGILSASLKLGANRRRYWFDPMGGDEILWNTIF